MQMDSGFRPQSPDLNSAPSYAPRSPDLSGLRPQSPDLSSALGSPPQHFAPPSHHFPGTSAPANHHHLGPYLQQPAAYDQQHQHQQYFPHHPQHHPFHPSHPQAMPPRRIKRDDDDDEYSPRTTRSSVKQEQFPLPNGIFPPFDHSLAPPPLIKSEDADPALGCRLNTSFPVARIKRIMQADEDIGKVAQVTPTVVSRALELFMIKLISAAAHQARGPSPAGGGSTPKGPRRVLAQHFKKAVVADEKFDFLKEIVEKVPDAPAKAKKENGSDSEDAKPRRRGKRRKESGEDI